MFNKKIKMPKVIIMRVNVAKEKKREERLRKIRLRKKLFLEQKGALENAQATFKSLFFDENINNISMEELEKGIDSIKRNDVEEIANFTLEFDKSFENQNTRMKTNSKYKQLFKKVEEKVLSVSNMKYTKTALTVIVNALLFSLLYYSTRNLMVARSTFTNSNTLVEAVSTPYAFDGKQNITLLTAPTVSKRVRNFDIQKSADKLFNAFKIMTSTLIFGAMCVECYGKIGTGDVRSIFMVMAKYIVVLSVILSFKSIYILLDEFFEGLITSE